MKKAIAGGLFVIVLLLTMTGIVPSCTHETLTLATFDTVCFERDVLPVFQNGCATTGCHTGQGEAFALNTYESIIKRITPGSAAQSRIYQAITTTLIQPMPPGHALAESDRIRIRIWIEQGAKPTTCKTDSIMYPLVQGGVK